MEDPTIRGRAPTTLLRACERGRLEDQFMSDAYEYLVPIVRCRCDQRRRGVANDRLADSEHRVGRVSQACHTGGGP
jgi:hypothetical protein